MGGMGDVLKPSSFIQGTFMQEADRNSGLLHRLPVTRKLLHIPLASFIDG